MAPHRRRKCAAGAASGIDMWFSRRQSWRGGEPPCMLALPEGSTRAWQLATAAGLHETADGTHPAWFHGGRNLTRGTRLGACVATPDLPAPDSAGRHDSRPRRTRSPLLRRTSRVGVAFRILCAILATGRAMRMPRGIGHLVDLAALPAVGAGVGRGRWMVGRVRGLLLTGHADPRIACRNHLRVALPIGGEAHHQLRNAMPQLLVLVGVPGMPGLAIGAYELLHQFVFC